MCWIVSEAGNDTAISVGKRGNLDTMPRNLIPMLCNYGGEFKIEAEKVCYRGGITRLIHVDQNINMVNLQLKLKKTCVSLPRIAAIKYRKPDMGCDLQLVPVKNDVDLTKMKNIFFLRSNSVPIELYIFAADINCPSACSTNNSSSSQAAVVTGQNVKLKPTFECKMTISNEQRRKAESKDSGSNKTPKIGCKEGSIHYAELAKSPMSQHRVLQGSTEYSNLTNGHSFDGEKEERSDQHHMLKELFITEGQFRRCAQDLIMRLREEETGNGLIERKLIIWYLEQKNQGASDANSEMVDEVRRVRAVIQRLIMKEGYLTLSDATDDNESIERRISAAPISNRIFNDLL